MNGQIFQVKKCFVNRLRCAIQNKARQLTGSYRKRSALGKLGEKLALCYLLQKGYAAISKNHYEQWGELDLVIKKDKTLVFVEVKTRKSLYFGTGEEAVNWWKKQKLIRTIHKFIKHNPSIEMSINQWRLDLVNIDFLTKNKATIRHFENILE